MHRDRHLRRVTAAALAALAAASAGCVFEDINEGIQGTNAQLASTNRDLDRLNEQVAEVKKTREQLGDLQERLEILRSIDESLRLVHEDLESLRGTLARIDRTIPFLNLSPDNDEKVEAAETIDELPDHLDSEGLRKFIELMADEESEQRPATGDH